MKIRQILENVSNPRPFAIITAYRHEYSTKENKRRNHELEQMIKTIGAKTQKTIGKWKETSHKQNKPIIDVEEESYLVVKPQDMPKEQFIKWILYAINKFGQDAVIYGDNDNIYLIDKDGNITNMK